MLDHPIAFKKNLPLSQQDIDFIRHQRVYNKKNFTRKKKLYLFVGPCSIHDYDATVEYARKLHAVSLQVSSHICIIMRAFIEKSRTGTGWQGFVYDPHLNNSNDIEYGLVHARKLFLTITKLGLPLCMEFIDPWILPYFDDLLSWGFVGARSSTSMIHRKIASNLDFPVGFKNGLDGDLKACIHSMDVATNSHTQLFLNQEGSLQTRQSKGNPFCLTTLRGTNTSTNYQYDDITYASLLQRKGGHHPYVLVDCAHGNSNKTLGGQRHTFHHIKKNIHKNLLGVMLESYLQEGSQPTPIQKEISITDPCLSFAETKNLIDSLYQALLHQPNKGAYAPL